LFTIKGNLVIMNHLYRKIAITSVCTALSFALGANKEAKAATITLPPATSFGVKDQNMDGQLDSYYSGVPFSMGFISNQSEPNIESRAFYEFYIANLSLPSNTVISDAFFLVRADLVRPAHRYFGITIEAYKGNGQPDTSDYYAQSYAGFSSYPAGNLEPKFNTYFGLNLTEFVKELISNKEAFVGIRVRESASGFGGATFNDKDASLIITTVPEPTTIFGSALALSLGGWLKRKNSSRQNKTKPQH
jgi:hypothetical protein